MRISICKSIFLLLVVTSFQFAQIEPYEWLEFIEDNYSVNQESRTVVFDSLNLPQYAKHPVAGDLIGAFYKEGDNLVLGGAANWSSQTLNIYKKDASGAGSDYGFETGDTIYIKIWVEANNKVITPDFNFSGSLLFDTQPQTLQIYYYNLPSQWVNQNSRELQHNIVIPSSASITVDGVPISNGDHIGVFYDSLTTFACSEFMKYEQGSTIILRAFPDTKNSVLDKNGFGVDEQLKFRIWQASTNTDFWAVPEYDFPNDDSLYVPEATTDILRLVTNKEYNPLETRVNIFYSLFFGDVTQRRNYRLIGLPGFTDIPLGNIAKGEYGEDWVAFYENGDGSLIGYESGSEKFTLGSGKGLWVLSKNPILIDHGFTELIWLKPNDTRSIALKENWNIITNPFGETIDWQAVKSLNGLTNNLYYYYAPSGNFRNTNSFQPYTSYYFLNEGTDSLIIPHPGSVGNIASKENNNPTIKITVLENNEFVDEIIFNDLMNNSNATDQQAPPVLFGSASLSIDKEGKALKESVVSLDDVKENLRFNLKNDIGQVELKIENNSGYEFVLNSNNNLVGYNLNESSSIVLTQKGNYSFTLSSKNSIENGDIIPVKTEIAGNYPNPFNPTTTLVYSLNKSDNISLKLFNTIGEEISTLYSGFKQAGRHQMSINLTEKNLTSGVYFVVLQAGNERFTHKILLLK